MTMLCGRVEQAEAVRAVVRGDRAAVAGLGAADWTGVVAECQRLVNAASAVQAQAMARAAAYRTRLRDDGTRVEEQRSIGTRPLDAGSLVSDELATSDQHAAKRVAESVEQVAR